MVQLLIKLLLLLLPSFIEWELLRLRKVYICGRVLRCLYTIFLSDDLFVSLICLYYIDLDKFSLV